MRTVDTIAIAAPLERVWHHVAHPERWPALLPHYRWVRRLEGLAGGDGVVDMAARRPLGGPLGWPAWMTARIRVEPAAHRVRYRHIAGVTRGMDVAWTLAARADGGTAVTLVHDWAGPPWPLIGPLAASLAIGPVLVRGITSRTLAGIRRAAEAG
jgi:hypothetical protein